MNSKIKKVLLFIIAVLAATAFWLGLVFITLAFVGDAKSGALTGKPETGYGIIAALFALPFVIGFGALSFFTSKKYANKSKTSLALIVIVSLVLTLVVGAIIWQRDKNNTVVITKSDQATADAMYDVYSSAGAVFAKTKSIPATIDTKNNVTYAVTDSQNNIYKVCGDFEKDTLSRIKGSPMYAKIFNEQVFVGLDAVGIYGHHQVGTQCYRVQIK